MLTTEARQTANQANAQHSTGPKTPEGKAATSRNAVTLGLFSSRDLVRPEEESEYLELRASLESDLRPATAMERTHAAPAPTPATTSAAPASTSGFSRRSAKLRLELDPHTEPQPEGLVSRHDLSRTSPAKPAVSSCSGTSPEPTASNPSFGVPWLVEEGRGRVKIFRLLQTNPFVGSGRRPERITLSHRKKGDQQAGGEKSRGGSDAPRDAANETRIGGIEQIFASRVEPVRIEQDRDGELVADIEKLRYRMHQQMAHEAGGEGQQGHEHQKQQVDPEENAVDVADAVERYVMKVPESAGDEKRDDEGRERRPEREHLPQHFPVGGMVHHFRDFQLHDKQRHRDGEDPVAQAFDP
jgi:hypothetical protein